MVHIKILLTLILIFVSKQALTSQGISIIRDAEIEYFLYKVIKKTISEKANYYFPRLVSNDDYNAFVVGSNKIYIKDFIFIIRYN